MSTLRSRARLAFVTPLAAGACVGAITGFGMIVVYYGAVPAGRVLNWAVLGPAYILGICGVCMWLVGPEAGRTLAGLKLAAGTAAGFLVGRAMIAQVRTAWGIVPHTRSSTPLLLLGLGYLLAVAGAFAGAAWAHRRRSRRAVEQEDEADEHGA